MIRRSPSLFVTFGIAFFAVLVLAIILHSWLLHDLIRPLIAGWQRDRISVVAEAARDELAARYLDLDDSQIEQVLSRHSSQIEGLFMVLLRHEGTLVTDHPIPPMLRRGFQRRLEEVLQGQESDSGDLPAGALEEAVRGDHPPEVGRRQGPWGRARPWGFDMPGKRERREIFTAIELVVSGEPVGRLVAVMPPGFGRRSAEHGNPQILLVILPLALVLAGIAGLVVFRLLTRRLRALEELAGRISQGDLTARVENLGRDEIGRLGQRLNEMTENLARARNTIAANDQQRRRLLADISHELATPLTSIRGYAETLLDPAVPISDSERTEYLRRVGEEAQRMDVLIDDVLELSRLESGSIPLHKERLDWQALCRNTLARYQERFEAAGLRLRMTDSDREHWIEVDGRRTEQVVENLLSNALRYVPAGGLITLTMKANEDETIALTVWDDGPGFSEKDLPHVFDRFYRADAARAGEGTGLGLAIVREIVLQHGGRIEARNLTGGGAAIEIALPGSAMTDPDR